MEESGSTVLLADQEEFLQELSEYLDVLGNPTRLRILKVLEKKSLDARSISIDIETSYENSKKHLEKLLKAGIISRRPGLGRETSKGVHPAWEYFLVPGSLDSILRDLGIFSTTEKSVRERDLENRILEVRKKITLELTEKLPLVVIIGGQEDGRIFSLDRECILIGRTDPDDSAKSDKCGEIVLPDSYRSVTRISRPHARIFSVDERYFIQDCGSTGGTFINRNQLHEKESYLLQDGDAIQLTMASFGATLLFLYPLQERKGKS